MSSRRDISEYLVHFTKGDNDEEAFQCLCKIVKEKTILGTSSKIKGAYECVCFSEAPLNSLEKGLVNPDSHSRYSPFGIIFKKSWIFKCGGRPVIYQSDAEFSDLPEKLKWRHVIYEPSRDFPIDFTWEREWRIQSGSLHFDSENARIVCPDINWAMRMVEEHKEEQDIEVQMYSQIMDSHEAEQHRETFPWNILCLK